MSKRLLALVFLLLCACDGSVRRDGPREVEFQLVRVDAAHNRRWVLELDALTVYDNLGGRRLRRLVLPDWVVAGPDEACPPDLVLDPSGAAYVSSNVMPVLWRIDPRRFELARIDITPDTHGDRDFGFTRLAFAGRGVLLAQGTTFGSSWRIDLATRRAAKVGLLPGCHAAEHDEQRHVVGGFQQAAQD